MIQKLKFESSSEDSVITETFGINTTDSIRSQIINMYIHLELFFEKLNYSSKECHKSYIDMLKVFGLFDDVKTLNMYKEDLMLEGLGIHSTEEFINKINEDNSFAYFIYDFLKEKG